MQLDRRQFVFSLAALASAPPRELLGRSRAAEEGSSGFLTQEEKALLGHLCEQIIPKDDFPGARELGVVEFIDRMLREAHPDWVVVYRAGLRATELSSQEEHGKPFADLEFEEQTRFLERMQRGGLPSLHWLGIPSDEFFSMVRSHTMQGYYSHPKWGGNRDRQAWKMIGYDDWWV